MLNCSVLAILTDTPNVMHVNINNYKSFHTCWLVICCDSSHMASVQGYHTKPGLLLCLLTTSVTVAHLVLFPFFFFGNLLQGLRYCAIFQF